MEQDRMNIWAVFTKLCEEFPELYDKYVEKVEMEIKDDIPAVTKEDIDRAWRDLRERIKNEQGGL